jgi:hypothetical protein
MFNEKLTGPHVDSLTGNFPAFYGTQTSSTLNVIAAFYPLGYYVV